MKRNLFLIFVFAALLFPSWALGGRQKGNGNEWINSYTVAKRLFDAIYRNHRETLYCGFPYEASRYVPLPPGFIIASYRNRAYGMEREHVVAVENFGRAFPEWRDGSPFCVRRDGSTYKGRDCAAKTSERFRLMYCDLHNLFPSVGCVNARRRNYEFEQLRPDAQTPFGPTCPMKFEPRVFSDGGKTHRSVVVEPPDRSKGIVARAYKYMDWAYQEYNMSPRRRRIMDAWDKQFPPDAWECERNLRIKAVQGNGNPFIESWCRGGGPLVSGKSAQDALPEQKQVLKEQTREQTSNKHDNIPWWRRGSMPIILWFIVFFILLPSLINWLTERSEEKKRKEQEDKEKQQKYKEEQMSFPGMIKESDKVIKQSKKKKRKYNGDILY